MLLSWNFRLQCNSEIKDFEEKIEVRKINCPLTLVYPFIYWENRCLGINWRKTHMPWACYVFKKHWRFFMWLVIKITKYAVFSTSIRGCFPLQNPLQMIRWILASAKCRKNTSLFQLMQTRHECNLGSVHSYVAVKYKIYFHRWETDTGNWNWLLRIQGF